MSKNIVCKNDPKRGTEAGFDEREVAPQLSSQEVCILPLLSRISAGLILHAS